MSRRAYRAAHYQRRRKLAEREGLCPTCCTRSKALRVTLQDGDVWESKVLSVCGPCLKTSRTRAAALSAACPHTSACPHKLLKRSRYWHYRPTTEDLLKQEFKKRARGKETK